MAERNDTGRAGEEKARLFLEEKGYRILHANWHWHHYELDIVAMHAGELVVAEVKTRTGGCLVAPEEAVDRGKIRRIVAAADAYVRRFGIEAPVRFDLLLVMKEGNRYRVEQLEDAFYAPLR